MLFSQVHLKLRRGYGLQKNHSSHKLCINCDKIPILGELLLILSTYLTKFAHFFSNLSDLYLPLIFLDRAVTSAKSASPWTSYSSTNTCPSSLPPSVQPPFLPAFSTTFPGFSAPPIGTATALRITSGSTMTVRTTTGSTSTQAKNLWSTTNSTCCTEIWPAWTFPTAVSPSLTR